MAWSANVVLNKTKRPEQRVDRHHRGWAFGVAVAVYAVGAFQRCAFEPRRHIGLASIASRVGPRWPGYIAAQMPRRVPRARSSGSPTCRIARDGEPAWELAVFCTAPPSAVAAANWCLTEVIGTFVLVLVCWPSSRRKNLNPVQRLESGIRAFLVGILVWAIGCRSAGPTGYAINPAQ